MIRMDLIADLEEADLMEASVLAKVFTTMLEERGAKFRMTLIQGQEADEEVAHAHAHDSGSDITGFFASDEFNSDLEKLLMQSAEQAEAERAQGKNVTPMHRKKTTDPEPPTGQYL